MTGTVKYNNGHEHDFNGWTQATIVDSEGFRILGFEKYCLLCGLVQEQLPIESVIA